MNSLVQQIRKLPQGVIGIVLEFIPRNDTAQLLMDASKHDKLVLKYLFPYNVEDGDYKNELFSTLAPSVIGTNTYGDKDSSMIIFRSGISIGEKVRMMILRSNTNQSLC